MSVILQFLLVFGDWDGWRDLDRREVLNTFMRKFWLS